MGGFNMNEYATGAKKRLVVSATPAEGAGSAAGGGNVDHIVTGEVDGVGFEVLVPPLSATADKDRREFAFRDARGHPVVTLRHQPRGSIPLPFYPFTTEVWTQPRDEPLQRRLFRWWGTANAHLSPAVASTFADHPFFRGVPAFRADPIPFQVMSSARETSSAAQLFTTPAIWA